MYMIKSFFLKQIKQNINIIINIKIGYSSVLYKSRKRITAVNFVRFLICFG